MLNRLQSHNWREYEYLTAVGENLVPENDIEIEEEEEPGTPIVDLFDDELKAEVGKLYGDD